MMNNTVFVGLGSNKNDRLQYLKSALKYIDEDKNSKVEKVSSVYETKPYGIKEQENFYNAAAKIKTGLSLKDFFIFCKEVEKKIGRTKNIRWGAREIDIDILIYNNLIYSDADLTIPHKEILLRDFVIVPLTEIEPGIRLPGSNRKLADVNPDEIEKNIIDKFSF